MVIEPSGRSSLPLHNHAVSSGHHRLANHFGKPCKGQLGRRRAEHLTRMDFIVLDEPRYLPFAQSDSQLLFHLISRLPFGKRLR